MQLKKDDFIKNNTQKEKFKPVVCRATAFANIVFPQPIIKE
jgi:hypothetical protein